VHQAALDHHAGGIVSPDADRTATVGVTGRAAVVRGVAAVDEGTIDASENDAAAAVAVGLSRIASDP